MGRWVFDGVEYSARNEMCTARRDRYVELVLDGMNSTQAAKAVDYEYTIREVSGSATGVTYDKTVYTVKVSVVDNLDGTMSATATYSSGLFGTDHKAPAFENTFTPPLSKTGADMAGVMAMVLLLLGGGVTILMIERRNAAGLDVASSAPRGRHGR